MLIIPNKTISPVTGKLLLEPDIKPASWRVEVLEFTITEEDIGINISTTPKSTLMMPTILYLSINEILRNIL